MSSPPPPPVPAPPPPAAEEYRREPDPKLDPARIIATIAALQARIEERFPGSGLGRVAAELLRIARLTVDRVAWVTRPNLWLRAAAAALVGLLVGLLGALLFTVRPQTDTVHLAEFLQAVEAGINDLLLIGAAIFFLVTAEGRIKRRRALGFLRELRAVAHVVDMHQLSKDPDAYLHPAERTPSSPARQLSPYELSRYLDYCSEMLALNSKLAALYAQNFDDPVVLGAVDEVETLTSGLAGKIWQKIVIVNRSLGQPEG
ncbi:MAG TPA: hypothetical protein VFX98_07635 [Longimicrobiaceae bacterium]|nr:hypothetical protein [Longimicrobiaceae bacterium]